MKRSRWMPRCFAISVLVTAMCLAGTVNTSQAIAFTVRIARTAPDVVVTIPARLYAAGETVTANMTGAGQVGIESELAQASASHNVSGSRDVSIGVVNGEGLHVVRFTGATGDQRFLVSVLASGNRYSVSGSLLSVVTPDATLQPLLTRFWKGLNYDRLKAAAATEVPKWMLAHHVGVGVTVVICFVPGQQVTCALGTGQHLADLGTSVLSAAVESMAKDGLITRDEATRLKATVGIGNAIAQIAMAEGLLGRVTELGTVAVEAVLPSEDSKVLFTITTDVANKYNTAYKVLKKLP